MSELLNITGQDKQTLSNLSTGLWRFRRLLFHQEECSLPVGSAQSALLRLRYGAHMWKCRKLLCVSKWNVSVVKRLRRASLSWLLSRAGVACLCVCVCPTVFAEMSRQVQHHHQSCCFEREPTLRPLCSECESSISLCTQHAREPPPPPPSFFFLLFPSLVTGKGSIFLSIFGHMEHGQGAVAFWCCTNIPILCGICTFWNAFSPIRSVCGCSVWKCTSKRDTRLLKVTE